MAEQLHRTFVSTLESLPDPLRQLLALREFDGLDAAGAGAVLGMSGSQARIGLFYARQQMRSRLLDRMRPGAM